MGMDTGGGLLSWSLRVVCEALLLFALWYTRRLLAKPTVSKDERIPPVPL